jgi:tetratricopeptide (TPR) repeat protein
MAGDAVVARAQSVLDAVGADPAAALAGADALIAEIGRSRDPEALQAAALCHRAAGLALGDVGRAADSEDRLRRAVRLADRSGSRGTMATTRMSLAFVLMQRGSMRTALAAADHATSLATAEEMAHVRIIRALVLQRWGRTREAIAEYAVAQRELREDDAAWEARLRNNRALLLAYEGDSAAAEADLQRSRELYLAHGDGIDAVMALWNFGWVRGMAGDLPGALSVFDRAEQELAALSAGFDVPEWHSDRAEVLLRAGLVDEAVRSARAGCELAAARGWLAAEAEARLLHALSLLEAGDAASSALEAQRARGMLARQDRPSWAALARYVEARADLALDPGAAPAERAATVAMTLRDLGWESPAADLRIAAGRRALEARRMRRAHIVLGPLAMSTRSPRPDVRSRAWLARALLDLADGSLTEADAALRRAWRVVDDQQLLIGASDLRAGGAALASDVVAVGTRMALDAGSADDSFAWAERGRAASLRFHPLEGPSDERLSRALTRLRWSARAEGDAVLSGSGSERGRARRERRQREHEVMRAARSAPASQRTASPPARRDVSGALGTDDTFVHLIDDRGDLYAVVIRRTSRSLVRLGRSAAVSELVKSVRFCQRRLITGFGTATGLGQARVSLSQALGALDAALARPLLPLLGDGHMAVCPIGASAGAPWPLLPSLRGRTIAVAPSAALWLRAKARRDEPGSGPVVVVAGPGLPHAAAEAEEVARLHRSSRLMVGREATTAAALSAAEGASLLHIAAHGSLRRDNPLFSELVLDDGPLILLELERLERAPRDVVLPACSAGDAGALPSDDLLGLALSLLGAGSASVIAPLLPVPDEASRRLMVAVHRLLADGEAPATALARAQQSPGADEDGVAGAFVCFGA